MQVLKVKKWKEKKDDLPQFYPVATRILSRGSMIRRVTRNIDGCIFDLNKVFWHKKGNTLKITEFHKDLICVSYQCDEFDGTIEINNIIVNDDEFIGFI
jgi:hypothetical protein